VDMDIHGYPWIWISMDIHRKSVDMDMDMDVKFNIHGNPENIPPLACCNSDTHEWILIFFGRNVTD